MRRRLLVVPTLLLAALGGAAEAPPEPKIVEQPEALPTLVNPNCSHCRDEARRRAAELKDDDRVLCWVRGKYDGGAIPLRFFLNRYRVISDTYGVFVHDAGAGYARGFEPSLDFRFHGWRNGVMLMKHRDGTVYSCLSGRAVAGPKKGQRLRPIPTLMSDWGLWVKSYPGSVAYHMFEKYQPVDLPAAGDEGARKSRGPADRRLPADAPVLGVTDGRQARAYPLAGLKKAGPTAVVTGRLGDGDCVILWQEATQTAVAFRPTARPPRKDDAAPRTLTLRTADPAVPAAPFVDQETRSRWDITGRAVEGRLKGWTLDWLDGVQVRWFAWAAEYPETTIAGEREGGR